MNESLKGTARKINIIASEVVHADIPNERSDEIELAPWGLIALPGRQIAQFEPIDFLGGDQYSFRWLMEKGERTLISFRVLVSNG